MIKIVDRYLLRQFLIPATYCLVTFTMVFIVFDIFDHLSELIDARPPAWMVARYYLCMTGPSLQYLAPASLMLAALYALYTLTRRNELVAMRACGLSLYRIMLPFVAVGIVFSAALLVLWETAIPSATEWADEFRGNQFHSVTNRTFENGYYFNTAARRQWQVSQFDVKHPEQLIGVEVAQETEAGKHASVVTADRARWLDGQWWFENALVQAYGTNDNPIGKPAPIGLGAPRLAEMRALRENPAVFANAARSWEYLTARDMYQYLATHVDLSDTARARKRYDLFARLASPWACLILTLFAIPAGARTGRQGALSAVFTAIALMIAFYAMSQLGMILSTTGTVYPWLGAWLSNIVFLLVGLGMMARMR